MDGVLLILRVPVFLAADQHFSTSTCLLLLHLLWVEFWSSDLDLLFLVDSQKSHESKTQCQDEQSVSLLALWV